MGNDSTSYGPNFTLGEPWEPDPALRMPDPNIPMPVLDDDASDREVRRATGGGYSDYT